MKFLTCILSGALTGLAAAGTPDGAEVYLLGSHIPSSSDATPRIPKEIARHILLQRASQDRYGNALGDIPNTIDEETAISHINNFGKSRLPLFGSTSDEVTPAQLVVILEGTTSENLVPLKKAFTVAQREPAFVVSDPPSAKANDGLIGDFRATGASNRADCTIDFALNPNDDSCWEGVSSVVRYDIRKMPDTVDTIVAHLDLLSDFVSKGELEAALVLMPESSRSSGANSWGWNPSTAGELRRRDSEAVLSDGLADQPAATETAGALPFALQDEDRPVIPQCFQSQNSCETRTNGCSGHGACVDKYARPGSKQVCFACHCQPQVIHEGEGEREIGKKTIKWGGNVCQKKDISSPFWLIVGFTVTIMGVLSFAIGLLYNIGEETLPGVIGAGVSRTK